MNRVQLAISDERLAIMMMLEKQSISSTSNIYKGAFGYTVMYEWCMVPFYSFISHCTVA